QSGCRAALPIVARHVASFATLTEKPVTGTFHQLSDGKSCAGSVPPICAGWAEARAAAKIGARTTALGRRRKRILVSPLCRGIVSSPARRRESDARRTKAHPSANLRTTRGGS